ncbi:MAG: hypothetical protein HIU82_16525, partial [Proteobacteria bacterium]|nr:hypothetical protein [Pseudomonadota bacterium]
FAAGDGTERVRIDLPGPRRVVDLMDGRVLGRVDVVTVVLGTVRPAVLAISP